MTKKEIKECQLHDKKCIERIERKLNVCYWYYDNGFKVYRFRIPNCEESLDLPISVMEALNQNGV